MAKERTSMFFCSECGYDSAKWTGQCPVCKAWNTMIEEKVSKSSLPSKVLAKSIIENRPKLLKDIELDTSDRYSTYIDEFDRVLGGGIVIGSLVLVGGDPGIGKSTILLQVCKNLSNSGRKLIYVSGEESLKQIKLRANRIGLINTDMKLFCETDLSIIQQVILEERPEVVVIDSIQTMFTKDIGSAPGSVSQVRESTNVLMQLAKTNNIAIFIVGHVTKDGQVAGPRVLEHMVDTVLYFEGERTVSYRILRAVKNRFGSTNEIGVFEMRESGLEEVKNPSEYMLSGRPSNASGASVACLMEGSRPMLLEVQALITETVFGLPRRAAVGTDFNRVNLLMAVIEKRCGLQMSRYDAYINIAGGIKMNEPALDLSIIMSIVSGLKNRPIDDKTVIFGEVGLAGEVRAVSMAEYRIREAVKLGFTTCILPKISLEKLSDLSLAKKINLIGVKNIREAVGLI